MFEIGFLEIVLLAMVSLFVLGPGQLPGAVRQAALWIGRIRRSFNALKSEIEKEVGADEIRRQLRNEALADKLSQVRKQINEPHE